MYLSRRRQAQAEQSTFVWADANPFSIGIQDNGLVMNPEGPWVYQVKVIGFGLDCERDTARDDRILDIETMTSDRLIVSSRHDYCGWNRGGAVVEPTAFEYGERLSFDRLTSAEARERLGSLWPMDRDHPLYPLAVSEADALLASVRRRDLSIFEHYESWGARWLARWYSDEVSSLRVARQNHQSEVFWQLNPEFRIPEGFGETAENLYVCYCLEEDCSGRWPISDIDTLATRNQPYLCVGIYTVTREDATVETGAQLRIGTHLGIASPFSEASNR